MPKQFVPTKAFTVDDFPPDRKKPFPIVEVLGYDRLLLTPEAREAFVEKHCPFAGRGCEKFDQYGFGYCSVQYKSKYDETAEVYAVCDHRLDGTPVQSAIADYFKANSRVQLIEELKLTNPDQSFDFIAIDTTADDFIAIETQAIDLRGGGVGPAWQSIVDGNPDEWRDYFTTEAAGKNRKDSVDYGVNMANITKRLGFQVADKGPLLVKLKAKLYVVAQDRCFKYFCSRIPAQWTSDRKGQWDITFITFDYTGTILPNGQRELAYVDTKRTTLASFSSALNASTANITREDFLKKIKERVKKRR